MEIFLVRSAPVEKTNEVTEAYRPLSRRGHKRMSKAVKGLQLLGVAFDHIFHSPWVSAVETTELLVPLNTGSSAPTELLAAEPGTEAINLARQFALDRSNPDAKVALVGHKPWLSQLASILITGDTQHANNLTIKKAGLVWLKGVSAPGGAELVASLPGRVLRKLAPKSNKPHKSKVVHLQ